MHTYESDIAAWADEQALALREHRTAAIDWEHLAEEIEDLTLSILRSLRSDIFLIIKHLLKWQAQSEHRLPSWVGTIRDKRRIIKDILRQNPSLKNRAEDLVREEYEEAVEEAADETSLKTSDFPAECPFTFDAIMSIPVSRADVQRPTRRKQKKR
jgi:hypothetical protein